MGCGPSYTMFMTLSIPVSSSAKEDIRRQVSLQLLHISLSKEMQCWLFFFNLPWMLYIYVLYIYIIYTYIAHIGTLSAFLSCNL